MASCAGPGAVGAQVKALVVLVSLESIGGAAVFGCIVWALDIHWHVSASPSCAGHGVWHPWL
jgi:hypothetical protein